MDSPSSKELSSYSDEELREHFKEYRPRWVVPQEVLEQGYALSQSIPEGSALVLQAVLETKEQA